MVFTSSKIHPLFNVSWQAASALYKARHPSCSRRIRSQLTLSLQLVIHQLRTDAALVDMVEQMRKAFDFSKEANNLDDHSKLLKPVLKDLLIEIADCAQFVQDYAKLGFSGVCSRHLSIRKD